MKDASDRHALERTLEVSGIGLRSLLGAEILAFAPANEGKNRDVHRVTNELLHELLLKDSLADCIHVTGEMRALLDPLHRSVCSAIYHRGAMPFSVVYGLPLDRRTTPLSAVQWSVGQWSSGNRGSWLDQLRALKSLSNREIRAYAADTHSDIQYSVFGGEYVLLQEPHADGANSKRVWLLRSTAINEFFTERAIPYLSDDRIVPSGSIRQVLDLLGGMAARYVLSEVGRAGHIGLQQLADDQSLGRLEEFPGKSLEALISVQFIHVDRDQVVLTRAGSAYAGMLRERVSDALHQA